MGILVQGCSRNTDGGPRPMKGFTVALVRIARGDSVEPLPGDSSSAGSERRAVARARSTLFLKGFLALVNDIIFYPYSHGLLHEPI